MIRKSIVLVGTTLYACNLYFNIYIDYRGKFLWVNSGFFYENIALLFIIDIGVYYRYVNP